MTKKLYYYSVGVFNRVPLFYWHPSITMTQHGRVSVLSWLLWGESKVIRRRSTNKYETPFPSHRRHPEKLHKTTTATLITLTITVQPNSTIIHFFLSVMVVVVVVSNVSSKAYSPLHPIICITNHYKYQSSDQQLHFTGHRFSSSCASGGAETEWHEFRPEKCFSL